MASIDLGDDDKEAKLLSLVEKLNVFSKDPDLKGYVYTFNDTVMNIFHTALKENLKEVVGLCIRVLPTNDRFPDTSAMACAVSGTDPDESLKMVKLLVSSGYEVGCAFVHAARIGRLEIVKYLVSIGVDINIDKGDAIVQSALYHHWDVLRYLISIGAKYTGMGLEDFIGLKRLPRSREQLIAAIDIAAVNNE